MFSVSALSQPQPETLRSIPKKLLRHRRAAGAVAMLGLLALALVLATCLASPLMWRSLGSSLFNQLAWLTVALSAGWALLAFRGILRAYHRIAGFPWTASLSFAAAASLCLLALHACIS